MLSKKHIEGFTNTDHELVKSLMNGSHAAFAELYARYKGRLMYFCTQFLKNNAASEDLIQDIFIQLWESRRELNPGLSFSAYIHTLAQNRILNIFRHFDVHHRFVQTILKNQLETNNQTEDEIIDKDLEDLLHKAIESLSPKQKEVFRLSRIQGFTYKEISELLHISVPTVQEHASLALNKIKKYLSQHTDIHVI